MRQLEKLLEAANRAYYVDANPTIPDAEFDRLLEELSKLESEHPEKASPNSPTKRVGGEPIEGFVTLPHDVPMLSIDNSYSTEDISAWIRSIFPEVDPEFRKLSDEIARAEAGEESGDASLFGEPGEKVSKSKRINALKQKKRERIAEAEREGFPIDLVCDPKIDGVALSVRYENGAFVRALTRGDGREGDDVSHAVRTIRALPLTLGKDAPDVFEIRGEVYIPNAEFERINAERAEAGDELFMNPRNACAGTLKNLDPNVAASRNLGFRAHGRDLGRLVRAHTRGDAQEVCATRDPHSRSDLGVSGDRRSAGRDR